MKVIGIVGSSRKKGNTSFLMEQALNACQDQGLETELLYLSDYQYRDCIGCEGCQKTNKCVIKDDMQIIYEKIDSSDGIIVGSPTYFYNITGLMKSFIDRLYCYQIFDDDDRSLWSSVNELNNNYKFASVIAICEQNNPKDMGFTAEAMALPLTGLGYRVVDTLKVLHCFKKDEAKDKDFGKKAQEVGTRLSKLILKKDNYGGND